MTTFLVICAIVALVLMADLISKAIDIRSSLADVARESSNLHRTLTQLHADKNKDTAKLICSIEATRSSCEGIRMTEEELQKALAEHQQKQLTLLEQMHTDLNGLASLIITAANEPGAVPSNAEPAPAAGNNVGVLLVEEEEQ